jgi:hypothetical protein
MRAFRIWLIKLLAGNDPIILNVEMNGDVIHVTPKANVYILGCKFEDVSIKDDKSDE